MAPMTGFGSLTSHPYQYQTSKYAPYASDYPQQSSQYYPSDPYANEPAQQPNEFSNEFTNSKIHGQSVTTTNAEQQQQHHQDKSRVPPPQHHHHPGSSDEQQNAGQTTKPVRREPSLRSQPLPPIGQRPPSSSGTGKGSNPPAIDLRMTKSTAMRAAAIKQKEEVLEKKRRDAYFPSDGKKTTPNKTTKEKDKSKDEQPKFKRSKKQSHSVPKQRRSRRMNYLSDNSSSSSDEDQRSRSKSRKAAPPEKYPALPPVRRGRLPPPPPPHLAHPYYDSMYDYPPSHPMRRRFPPYYDDYPPYAPYPYPPYPPYRANQRGPPYLPPYHDPYDGFFDYEKRKVKPKSKSRGDRDDHGGMTGNETEREDERPSKSDAKKKSKTKGKKTSTKDETPADNAWPDKYPPTSTYFDEGEALETWRQERNDYLKKKFKPTIHEVLYSQQWMKADSYLENQRRRALRDTQGYYFPYKQYTLKDYKDLQRSEATKNPYAPIQDPLTERKERPRKPPSNVSQRSGKPLGPLKPIHPDPEKSSKRERALEYAKVQVLRHPAQKGSKDKIDPTEEYVNNLFPRNNDDDDEEEEEDRRFQEQRRRNRPDQRQSEGDDDENQ